MNIAATSAASSAAIVAAAAARRRMHQEEERMTSYQPQDMDGWEFKILRSTSSRFRDKSRLRAVLDEEVQTGWELVEKFDDRRIRLKRRVEWREKDAGARLDPYRTWVGMSQSHMAAWFLGVLIALMTLGVAIAVAIQ